MRISRFMIVLSLTYAVLGMTAAVTAQEAQTPAVSVIDDLPNEESGDVQQAAPANRPQRPQKVVEEVAAPVDDSVPQVIVMVDKTQQLITISSPGTADMPDGMLVAPVSTGGGWKTPIEPFAPYCADDQTPTVRAMIIKAVPNKTMYPMYYSGKFSDGEGNPVPMPYAIHVKNGIFLHQVPPGKEKLLGKNVSGGCIRLPAKVAKFLYKEMATYGQIQLSISGENPPPVPGLNDCSGHATQVARRPRMQQPPPNQFPQFELPQPLQDLKRVTLDPVSNFVNGLFQGQ